MVSFPHSISSTGVAEPFRSSVKRDSSLSKIIHALRPSILLWWEESLFLTLGFRELSQTYDGAHENVQEDETLLVVPIGVI